MIVSKQKTNFFNSHTIISAIILYIFYMDHTRIISLGQCFPLYSFFTLDKIVHVILLVTSVYSVFINILFSFVNESKCRRDCVLTVISLHVSLIAYKCRYPRTIGRTKVRVHRIFWLTKKQQLYQLIGWLNWEFFRSRHQNV